jgi:DNA-binding NarL/FixJ family response regulator
MNSTVNRPIRILLADDHRVVRHGFRLILSQQPDMQVVGEASGGREAVDLAIQLEPHVVILDIAMGDLSGVEAARLIRQNCPRSAVLILSMHRDAVYVRESLRAGAKGYLLKEAIDQDLLAAVRAVARGDGFLSPEISGTVLDDYQKHVSDPLDLVTNRERQILQLLASGKTSKEIATELDISVYTVDAHRSRMMKKLQLRSIGEVVKFALQRGLV